MKRPNRPHPHVLGPAFAAILLAALMAVTGSALSQQEQPARRPDVPYVPTPQPVVDKMLDIAGVGKDDVVYDLGCGDGRIVITAAKERGARGVGIDLNPQRIAEAKANAASAGVEGKVKFMVGDLFTADFSEASVVTLYLLPDVNRALRPQLWKQLKVGTRVVSHDFDMGPEWPPEKVERIGAKTIYYWTITSAQKRAIA
ncbi:class I SAM-dependent methyltransferase [Noviherbaspirillum denitrificans]|uniref:SAM-dependent methyltransferase n=1 Tax=Noviherbaspirillum denitrificans TaxID=1968433 RepID=A0A254TG44_9BURK|nr:SAM-dependent methyltransferase [Noviherbaspirillum denitrificans]